MKRNVEILLHVIFWVLYALNSTASYPSEYLDKFGFINIGVKQSTGILVYMVLFYFNYLILIPKILLKKKYLIYTFSAISLIFIDFGLHLIQSIFLDWYFDAGNFFWNDRTSDISYGLFQCFFYLLISTGARFTSDWFKTQKLKDELEAEKNKAELANLKYQISPHFLFNNMNSLYSLAYQNSPKILDAIIKLSGILRYIFKETPQEKVKLTEEIEFITNFIELQKLRLSNSAIVKFNYIGVTENQQIHPLILISFIENSFKHGDVLSDNSFIDIAIEADKSLEMIVSNRIAKGTKDKTSGIGIINVKRRLELLYPEKHELSIISNDEVFTVKLSIFNI